MFLPTYDPATSTSAPPAGSSSPAALLAALAAGIALLMAFLPSDQPKRTNPRGRRDYNGPNYDAARIIMLDRSKYSGLPLEWAKGVLGKGRKRAASRWPSLRQGRLFNPRRRQFSAERRNPKNVTV